MCIRDRRRVHGEQKIFSQKEQGGNPQIQIQKEVQLMKKILVFMVLYLMTLSLVQSNHCPPGTLGVEFCLSNPICCASGFGSQFACSSVDTFNQVIVQKLGRSTTKETLCQDQREVVQLIHRRLNLETSKFFCRCFQIFIDFFITIVAFTYQHLRYGITYARQYEL
eukprot:TRINITY_DN22_c0_g1_i1.p1 TRINITY_DN22_c0_g1~~TRINITY_DN22_c0_g1_i1.p1  ORF type:complete len:166 (+),score=4.29 TRINITY_DN22_c0_g1_i1:69-566(+)